MHPLHRRQFLLASLAAATSGAAEPARPFSIGLMADAQYADAPPQGKRHYRNSITKLESAVESFNRADLQLCVHLGDLIDRDWDSFAAPLETLANLRPPCLHILGNHDYSVTPAHLPEVPARLAMRENYFATTLGTYRFIFLDTNEVSTYAHAPGTHAHTAAKEKLTKLQKKKLPNAKPWNGALSDTQLAWLSTQCTEAATAGHRVVIFAHHPVFPADPHNLWNDTALLATIDQHPNVVAYFNGHNHAGAYATRKGIHYLTLHGMVDTPDTDAFAIATFAAQSIDLQGTGREPSRSLSLRA